MKNFWQKRDFILSFLLLLAFFISRIPNLMAIPIFTDEAIYLRWSQIAWHDASWRFISLTDGKQPLFMWLTIPFMKIGLDPLVAGRVISILAGLGSLIGIFVLSYTMFRRKEAAFWASFLYLIVPFTLFYDRIAVVDSLLTMFGIWVMLLQILLAKTERLDVALILGMLMGGGLLTKSPAIFYVYLFPLSLLFFNWSKEKRATRFVRWLFFALIAVVISEFMYNILRLSPWFHMVKLKDANFVVSLPELLSSPFKYVFGNLHALFDWWITYLTIPIFAIGVIWLFFVGSKNFWREKIILFFWIVFPLLASAAFAKIIYPRYLLFYTPPLLLLASKGIMDLRSLLKPKLLQILIFIMIFSFSIYSSFILITAPVRAIIPNPDRGQFIDDWPSGGGVNESVAFLRKQSEKGKITVVTEGTFGLMPYSIELYLTNNPNVEILSRWPVREIEKDILEKAKKNPTYFIFNETQNVPESFPLKLIARYQKGNGHIYLSLYQVLSENVK